MRSWILFTSVIVASMAFPGLGFATPIQIASTTGSVSYGTGGVFASVPLYYGDLEGRYDSDPFFFWTLTAADMGTTIYRDATDPKFAAFVANLTNGIDDWLVSDGVIYSGERESNVFGGVAGGNGIDLAGFSVARIGVRVDTLSIVSPRPDWTDVEATLTMVFEVNPSAVPEIDPAGMGSVLALVTGGLGLLERRRRRTILCQQA